MNYIIQNKNESDLAWSNTFGWCSETFDTFTQTEMENFNLPIDGEWVQVPWECGE